MDVSFTSAIRNAPRTLQAMLRSTLRAFAIVRSATPGGITVLALLTLVSGALPASIAYVAREVLDGVLRAARSGAREDAIAVYRWIAIELVLVIGAGAVGQWLSTTGNILAVRLGQFVDEQIIAKALTLRLAEFEDSEMQDQLNHARKHSGSPLDVVNNALDLARAAFALTGFGVLLAHLSAWTVMFIFVATVPQFVTSTYFAKKRFTLGNWRTKEARQQSYYEYVLTSVDTVKEVRLFALGDFFLDRYRAIYVKFEKQDRETATRLSLWMVAWSAIGSAAYYCAYGWVAREAIRSAITVGELGMYLLVFKQGQGMIASLLGSVASLYRQHLYLGPLFEHLDRASPTAPSAGLTIGTQPGDGFRFERVSFQYPGTPTRALDGIDLHIPAGHKLALVGENGAGKTTLIKLLTRLYTPTSGRILLDGIELSAWDGAALNKRDLSRLRRV